MFIYVIAKYLSLLQGGSWVFDSTDDTWKKLMSGVAKWILSKSKEISKPTYVFELCEMLAAKNEDFATQVFPKLSYKKSDVEQQNSKDPMNAVR